MRSDRLPGLRLTAGRKTIFRHSVLRARGHSMFFFFSGNNRVIAVCLIAQGATFIGFVLIVLLLFLFLNLFLLFLPTLLFLLPSLLALSTA